TRQQRDDATFLFDDEVCRLPAGARGCRSGFLTGRIEFVARERVRIGRSLGVRACRPGRRSDFGGRSGDARGDTVLNHAISNIASTSVATLRGSETAPTAERACLPASPNIST